MKTPDIDHIIDHVVGACQEHPTLGFVIGLVKGIVTFTLVCVILAVVIPVLVIVVILAGKVLMPFSLLIFHYLSTALGL